jgi:hypothetical protein
MSAMDTALLFVMPLMRMLFYGFLFCLMVLPAGYYFIVIKRRRQWVAYIWERRGETPTIVDKDLVIEKRIKRKNTHLYMLRKKKYAVHPVEERFVTSFKSQNIIHYLRVGSDYIPMRINFDFDKYTLDYVPMPYDVQMQMLSTDKLIEEMYKATEGFWQKYGAYIGLALIIVLMIVMMSMYYDLIKDTMGPIRESTSAINSIAQNLLN